MPRRNKTSPRIVFNSDGDHGLYLKDLDRHPEQVYQVLEELQNTQVDVLSYSRMVVKNARIVWLRDYAVVCRL